MFIKGKHNKHFNVQLLEDGLTYDGPLRWGHQVNGSGFASPKTGLWQLSLRQLPDYLARIAGCKNIRRNILRDNTSCTDH